MNTKLVASLLFMTLASPVLAEKPDWAGAGKPSQAQKEVHRTAMQTKDVKEERSKLDKEKKHKEKKVKDKMKSEKEKGIEKKIDKKQNQVQKDLKSGSVKGQESKEVRSKWWKFWGE